MQHKPATPEYVHACCSGLCACSKSELLVVVKQPEGLEGPTNITLITDNANQLVLHWGTSKPGDDDLSGWAVHIACAVAAAAPAFPTTIWFQQLLWQCWSNCW
jgi:hypothetical protein